MSSIDKDYQALLTTVVLVNIYKKNKTNFHLENNINSVNEFHHIVLYEKNESYSFININCLEELTGMWFKY